MALPFRTVVDPATFPSDSFRWRMGVRSLPADQWLQPDDHRSLDLVEKDLLSLRLPGQTFVADAGSEDASREVCALVAADLAVHGWTLRDRGGHPLETAGRSVQEDLCLMERRDGSWVLTAGSVCFPTRWDLPSKLGKSLAAIHAPVPAFHEHLGDRVDRFFDRMAPGSLAHRLNWSLVGASSRRLGAEVRQAPATLPDDPALDLFVRIERQTLRRLEQHDAVVFGIRIHVWPLGDVVSDLPADRFAREIETMPVDVARYKNLDGMRAALIRWLREQ